MKVLFVEDDPSKFEAISDKIYKILSENNVSITHANTLTEAIQNISSELFDLIIFDVYLPISNEASECQNFSKNLINAYTKSINYQTESIAITKYDLNNIEDIKEFNESGVTIVKYDDDSKWPVCLELIINKVRTKVKYDFLIFCALSKERSAYSQTNAILGDLKVVNGIDCQELNIGDMRGLCISPNRMGLVNMAITASKSIELFQPKIVAMSGICAGNPQEVNFLDVIIAETCWEYQTGKFKDNEFQQEPYQANINHELHTHLRHFISSPEVLDSIKLGLFDTPLKQSKLRISPISSGSAVIADEKRMKEIGVQHRKLAAIEMEMYSLYEASSQSICSPLFFGAKAVVDLGNQKKDDNLHNTGCIISARLVVDFLANKSYQH
jgi:nucleoside phosphorylase/CheY-like chemotaxis protein